MQFRITNVVAKLYAGQELDMDHVVFAAPGRYSKEDFPAAVTKCRDPKVTISAFHSGELVLAGATSVECALLAAYKYVAMLRRRLHNRFYSVNDFTVTNVVSIVTIGHTVNVDLFYEDHQFECTFKPDKFIGLTWRTVAEPPAGSPVTDKTKIAFVLFETGKVVVSGAKHKIQIAMAMQKLERMSEYKLGAEYRVLDEERRRTRKVAKRKRGEVATVDVEWE